MESRLIALLIVLCLPWCAFALDPGCTHYEGYLHTFAEIYPDTTVNPEGWYRDLAVKGQYAYTVVAYYSNQEEHLQVVDLGDPLDPQFLGFAGLNTRDHTCLDIWDHYLYIGGPGIKVVDVDDETAPVLVASNSAVNEVEDLVVGSGRLYATHDRAQVKAFSLGDPADPGLIGSLTPSFAPHALALQGDLLAVGGNQAVAIYDMANPSFPDLLGSLEVEGYVRALEWSGDRLLAGAYTGTVLIDTTDPAAPAILGDIPGTRAVSAIFDGDRVWIGQASGGHGALDRWDIADPAAPVLLGRTPCVGEPHGLAVAFGNAYTANWADDYEWVFRAPLVIYSGEDVATPPHLGQLGITPGYNEHKASAFHGDHFYVVDDMNIEVVDLADPRDPVLADSINIGSYGFYGNYLLVAGNNLLVRIWDFFNHDYYWDLYSLDDPQNPIPAGDAGDLLFPVARGNYLYDLGYDGIDVYESLPSHRLEWRGTLFEGVTAGYAVFHGNQAAFLYGQQEVLLAEMEGPLEAVEVGRIPSTGTGEWRFPLALADGLLISADPGRDVWEIWDVSDPSLPALLFTHPADYQMRVNRALVEEGILYIDGANAVGVWDLADPAQPQLLGEWPHVSHRVNMHARPGYWLTQDSNGYITTLPYQCGELSAAPEEDVLAGRPGLRTLASPNPTHGTTRVSFTLAEAGMVQAAVYDLRGQLVRRLVHQWMEPGPRNLVWNGRDGRGRSAAAGVYLVKVQAGARQATDRVVLLR